MTIEIDIFSVSQPDIVCLMLNKITEQQHSRARTISLASNFSILLKPTIRLKSPKEMLFGWFKCINGFTLASKLGFHILLNSFTKRYRQSKLSHGPCEKNFLIRFCILPTIFMLNFTRCSNKILRDGGSLYADVLWLFLKYARRHFEILMNMFVLKFRFIGTYCVNYHFSYFTFAT